MSLFKKSLLLVFFLLFIDQALKIWIKTTYNLGDIGPIIPGIKWARLNFTENKGAAFGILFGGDAGKLILSLFRIVAIIAITWYLYKISKQKINWVARLSVALILTGATGNMIDSAFYGQIFSSSVHSVATIFPENGGYAPFLYGHVVDMFYFPFFDISAPTWFPVWSWWPWKPGQTISFFPYIFNFADATITIGVVLIIFFKKSFLIKEIQ